MCGFIGFMSTNFNENPHEKKLTTMDMTSMITHRGPDDVGYYFDDHIHLGFRRLSIIDVESGSQPQSYEDRYWITFNGEIYNYLELKQSLMKKGYTFNTDSDTEVIVALYSHIGERVVNELRGMFSFIIWDKEKKELFGARDHFGIKPFFYYETQSDFYCSSEKKSILLALKGESIIDMESLHHYLTYQYVPEPSTLSIEISRLEPGSFFTKKLGCPMKIQSYFKPTFCPIDKPFGQEVKKIQDVLRDSVDMHLRSDVPVGAFLSGGIDSSSIVALASKVHPKIKTFTVGFEREGFSEIELAQQTAYELDVENIHYVVKPEELIKELPKIVWHLDEPVADPALVPLYFIAREARKHVKVVLSGEGADELFGGYNIYQEPHALKYFNYFPRSMRKSWNVMASMLPEGTKGKSYIERGTTNLESRYIGNAKIFNESEKEQLLKNYHDEWDFKTVTKDYYQSIRHLHDVQKMQFIDLHTWLRGDILVKADRMTMAHSLELRVPFLDKEVYKVASQLKSSLTVTNQQTKYIFRKAMEGIIPYSVLNRKKLGFPVPIRHWLQNELFDWAYQLIIESRTNHLFEKNFLLFLLSEHQRGFRDHSRKIWTVLIFMIWHQVYIEEPHQFKNLAIEKQENALSFV
ncbi:asparagine synthase (glutamine-hydrolyzing) [Metabacillus sp. FJAT-53654]|uniref:asparagine synthase (glutamine-hydrolyzing) n=1 Tax=Metabacillus rhizosphaerae TaxID=3117747 RepID=A0ABZ2MMN6_9BACI